MNLADDPRAWSEAEWHQQVLKVCALLDGMSIADANKVLDLVKTIISESSRFRMDSSEFQGLIKSVVCDMRKG